MQHVTVDLQIGAVDHQGDQAGGRAVRSTGVSQAARRLSVV
jgi:hypothetical protein